MDESKWQKGNKCLGQIVEEDGGSPVKDVTFQIRNHKMYIYTNSTWVLAENVTDNIEFGIFEKSNYNYIKLLDNSSLQMNNGVVSIPYQSDHFLHWFKKQWPINRYLLPESFEAIFITCEMKLISYSESDLSKVKFLACVSADYYDDYNTNSENNLCLVMPRHKYLTTEWNTFTAYITGTSYPLTEWEFKTEISKRTLPPMH